MSAVATYPLERKVLGYQQLTVSTTAVGLTVPAGATRAVITVEAQPLRYRADGTNPTASVGQLVQANVSFELGGAEALRAVRFIRSGGTDAVVSAHYFRS